jgi:hypothetical protein
VRIQHYRKVDEPAYQSQVSSVSHPELIDIGHHPKKSIAND